MRVSIFNRDNSQGYKDEYIKIIKELKNNCISFNNKKYSYFEYVNTHIFHNWKFRGTYLDCYSYLESLGININSKKITLDAFLNFLEFILNIQFLMEKIKYYYENTKFSILSKSIISHNIPLILESLGYQAYDLEDRIIIAEKDIDYSDLENMLPNDIYELALSYKSINNNGIKIKRIILDKIYAFILKDSEKYKSYNTSLYNCIKTVITKMGVCSDISKKYQGLSNYMLKKYYDECFDMMIYLIKTDKITKYRDEIKSITTNE